MALVKARQRQTSMFSTLTKLYSHVILICTWKNKLWTLLTHQKSPERPTGNTPAKGLETPFLPEASFQMQPCTMLATSEDVFIKLWKPIMLRLKPKFVPLCSIVLFSDGERVLYFTASELLTSRIFSLQDSHISFLTSSEIIQVTAQDQWQAG